MLERVWMLKGILELTKRFIQWRRGSGTDHSASSADQENIIGTIGIAKAIERIKRTPSIFFCKSSNLPKINEAITYVLKNEQTYCLRLVHVCEKNAMIPPEFNDIVCLFDHIYPMIKIDFVSTTGTFDATMIHWIVEHLKVPTNMMFMRQPATPAMHAVASAGVRVITCWARCRRRKKTRNRESTAGCEHHHGGMETIYKVQNFFFDSVVQRFA